MSVGSFFGTTAETQELHSVIALRSRYYKTNYKKAKAVIIEYAEKNKMFVRLGILSYINELEEYYKWKSKKIIDLDFSEKPFMTAEKYPNENKGRILLCTTHPEYMIWQDGHIEEADDKKFNCLATGLYQWKDITKLSERIDDD